tara:strand:+ start:751 stop:1764 length:1014 start_codon:yes stop_codon:yes gene_type:complete
MNLEDARKILEKYEKKKKKNINIKRNNTNLKNTTIENYITKIKFIHYNICNKKINIKKISNILLDTYNIKDIEYVIKNFNYLENKKIITYLYNKYENINTIKSYLIPFTVLCSKIDYYNENDVHKNLIEYIEKINKTYENDINNNSINIEDKNKLIINYDKEELQKQLEILNNIEEQLIFALYTFIPPRRLEYSNMIIKENDINLDNNYNYIIIDNNNPIKFVFNNYKTNKVFGKQIYYIDDNIKNLINEHILINNKKNSDLLFNYKSNNFGKKLTNIFKKVYSENITVRWLRISYTSYIRKQNLTNNELKIISEKMAHSLETNSKYNKIKMYDNYE